MKIRNLMFIFCMVFGLVSTNVMAVDYKYLEEGNGSDEEGAPKKPSKVDEKKEEEKPSKSKRLSRKISNKFLKKDCIVVTNIGNNNVEYSKKNIDPALIVIDDEILAKKAAQIFNAIAYYKLSKIKKILKKYPQVLTFTNENNQTPYMVALEYGLIKLSFALESPENWFGADMKALRKEKIEFIHKSTIQSLENGSRLNTTNI